MKIKFTGMILLQGRVRLIYINEGEPAWEGAIRGLKSGEESKFKKIASSQEPTKKLLHVKYLI